MKTLYGILTVISFAFLLFGGLYYTLQDVSVTNPRLTTDSIELIDKYNIQYQNLSQYAEIGLPNTNLSSNETNQIDAFFREYSEAKKNVNKFKSALNFVYHIPSLILLSIPIIDLGDTSLFIFNVVIWIMLSYLLLSAIYKAVRTGKVDNE